MASSRGRNENTDVRRLVEDFRKAVDGLTINESSDNNENKESVPYTNQDELMTNIMNTAKTQFGADFSGIKNPMRYYPADGDVVLSGVIRDMNTSFQFRFKDSSGNGCYIWVESLQLSDDVIRRLSVIHGVFKNWKDDLTKAEDYKPMSYRGADSGNIQNDNGGRQMVPGDDLD